MTNCRDRLVWELKKEDRSSFSLRSLSLSTKNRRGAAGRPHPTAWELKSVARHDPLPVADEQPDDPRLDLLHSLTALEGSDWKGGACFYWNFVLLVPSEQYFVETPSCLSWFS
jgi:hypothetical protein